MSHLQTFLPDWHDCPIVVTDLHDSLMFIFEVNGVVRWRLLGTSITAEPVGAGLGLGGIPTIRLNAIDLISAATLSRASPAPT
jgi:hypothetical protein